MSLLRYFYEYQGSCTTLHELSSNLYELGKHHWSGPLKLPSSGKLLREVYELLQYDTILKPRSDEFTTIFLRVSAITVRLSTSCLQISMSWENIIGLAH